MNKFYNSLYVQVCTAFSGLQDKCADTNRLCCNGINYCPVCKQSYYGCIGTDGVCTDDFYCEFSDICQSGDWCKPNVCADLATPSATSDGKGCKQQPLTFESAAQSGLINKRDFDRCYDYKCDSVQKKFVINNKLNCAQVTGDPTYDNCKTTCVTGLRLGLMMNLL
jgi:hypothetical protein